VWWGGLRSLNENHNSFIEKPPGSFLTKIAPQSVCENNLAMMFMQKNCPGIEEIRQVIGVKGPCDDRSFWQ
jgi:hypothetical protein